MIELPEAINLAKQMNKILVGKRVVNVYPPTKIHKFCWFSINPEDYCYNLKNAVITDRKKIEEIKIAISEGNAEKTKKLLDELTTWFKIEENQK